MDTYPRPATPTHDTWGLPWSRPFPPERAPVNYRLPDGSTVPLAWDLRKGALFVLERDRLYADLRRASNTLSAAISRRRRREDEAVAT